MTTFNQVFKNVQNTKARARRVAPPKSARFAEPRDPAARRARTVGKRAVVIDGTPPTRAGEELTTLRITKRNTIHATDARYWGIPASRYKVRKIGNTIYCIHHQLHNKYQDLL